MAEDSLTCQFCGHGAEVEDISGKLHAEEGDSGKLVSAHHRCMQYASGLVQYKCIEFGGFDINEVENEINRGKKLRCAICRAAKRKRANGASCGCAVKSCRKTYHFTCASLDSVAITKRLVVTKNRSGGDKEKFVLYRVFCSKAHEEVFRKMLKEDLRGNKQGCKSLDKKQESRRESESSQNEDDFEIDRTLPAGCDSSSPILDGQISEHLPLSLLPVNGKTDETDGPELNEHTDEEDPLPSPQRKRKLASPMAASRPSRLNKGRRLSGFLQSRTQRGGRSRVSQSPNCSLVQEVSETSRRSEPEGFGTCQIMAVSETNSGAVLNASVLVHVSPPENEEDGGSRDKFSSPKKGLGAQSLNNCYVSLENGLVCSPDGKASFNKRDLNHQSPSKRLQSESLNGIPTKIRQASPVNGKIPHTSSNRQDRLEINDTSACNGSESEISGSNLVVGLQPCKVPITGSPSPKTLHVPNGGNDYSPDAASSPPHKSIPVSQQRSPGRTARNLFSEILDKNSKDTTVPSGNNQSQGPEENPTASKSPSGVVRRSMQGDKGGAASRNAPPGNLNTNPHVRDTASASSPAEAAEQSSSGRRVQRKRKLSGGGDMPSPGRDSAAVRRNVDGNGDSDDSSQAYILLIPICMEAFERLRSEVIHMASKAFDVKANNLCVWQQTLSPQIIIFFLLDLLKELENENNEVLLNLLCDTEYLNAKLSSYVAQAEIFHKLKDEENVKKVQAALWSSFEKSVAALPMACILQPKGEELQVLAIDARLCQGPLQVLAFLQAYKGLFCWKPNTKATTFQLSHEEQCLATQSEVLTLQVWLTKVNPVTEVIVLPSDQVLLDSAQSQVSPEFLSLVRYLQQKIQASGARALEVDGGAVHMDGGAVAMGDSSSLQAVIPLLVFNPVDFVLLNFQQYFRKTCQMFFEMRGLVRVLALVPLSNVHCGSYEQISRLMATDDGASEETFSVTVTSAFCPNTQPISLVVLEVSSQPQICDLRATIGEPGADPIKRKRGRPRKNPAQTSP